MHGKYTSDDNYKDRKASQVCIITVKKPESGNQREKHKNAKNNNFQIMKIAHVFIKQIENRFKPGQSNTHAVKIWCIKKLVTPEFKIRQTGKIIEINHKSKQDSKSINWNSEKLPVP